jgi:cell wall assembly regulator SMI1
MRESREVSCDMAVRFQIDLRKSQEAHDGQTVACRIEVIRQQSTEMN